ncbi:MAG: hypothetical protein RLZZ455_1185 [Candidatus Parcubacteria bacterium]|jgi:large subunit ribosomal protein L18
MNQAVIGGKRRERRIRGKILGTASRPRLSVFRSNAHMYAQLIDDKKQETLLGVSDKLVAKVTGKTNIAKELGIALAKKALEKKIESVVFDKGSYAYHGRVKAIAEGAREGGLKF